MRWVGKNKLQRRWRPRPPDRVAAAVIVMTMLIHSVKLAVVVAVSLLHLIKNLRQQVEELNAEVGRQRQVIDTLTTRLNFVLSMFGADEVSLSVDKDTESATGSAAVKARDTDVSSSQKSFRGAVLSAVY